MKPMIGVLLILLLSACSQHSRQEEHAGHHMPASTDNYPARVNNGDIKQDTMKGSPQRIAMTNVGATHIHITYGSPGVKGRVIWGGLVPYDQVWASGAHNATNIQINKAIQVGNKTIDAGTYGFFTIPGKETWELILNKNYQQHLADQYKQEEDVVRVTVLPQIISEDVPRLTYKVQKTSDSSGEIVLKWERIKVALPFRTQ